jgi:hypothetical protein
MTESRLDALARERAALDLGSDADLDRSSRLAEEMAEIPAASLLEHKLHALLLCEIAEGDSSLVSRLAKRLATDADLLAKEET